MEKQFRGKVEVMAWQPDFTLLVSDHYILSTMLDAGDTGILEIEARCLISWLTSECVGKVQKEHYKCVC